MDVTLNIVLFGTLLVMIAIAVLLIRNSHNQGVQKDILKKKNVALTDLDAKKNEFLSFATHQIRTPLTSVKWGLDSLKEKFSVETIDHMLLTTEDLISTVNDLLDISKIEQGGMPIKKEEFDVHDFVGRLVEEFRMAAEKKGLKIVFEGDNVPCFITSDQTKLRQVFVNLIDNAIKYTKEGGIQVVFHKTGSAFSIEVTDTGPGIEKRELSELFDKFLRGKAGKESEGGSGLGLYLAKKIVVALGGEISAQSDGLGKGSSFKVKFPLRG